MTYAYTGKERIPLLGHGALSIKLSDTGTAANSVRVPLLTGGLSVAANKIKTLPAYVRIPLIHSGGGASIRAGDMASFQTTELAAQSSEESIETEVTSL